MDHQSLESTGAAVIPYGVGHTENLIRLILSLPNVCIHATPSYLSIIEKVAMDKFNLKPNELGIEKGIFGGEGGLDNKNYRDKLEKKWNMDIYNGNYGMSEVLSIIASENEDKSGLVFLAGDILYPEIYLKEQNQADNRFIKPGVIGELVLSHLKKESQGLIRYSTGDVIEIIEVKDDGEYIKEFKFRVLGRSDDMMVVKGINFYPESIRNVITQYKEFTGNYQIEILDTPIIEVIKLIIEIDVVYDDIALDTIRGKLHKEIKDKYFVSCNIVFVTKIEEDANKLKLVRRVECFE